MTTSVPEQGPKGQMSRGSYAATQAQLQLLGAIILGLPLDDFLEALERADSLGSVLDPTLYRAAHKKLDDVRELAEAFARVRAVARKHAAAGREAEIRTGGA